MRYFIRDWRNWEGLKKLEFAPSFISSVSKKLRKLWIWMVISSFVSAKATSTRSIESSWDSSSKFFCFFRSEVKCLGSHELKSSFKIYEKWKMMEIDGCISGAQYVQSKRNKWVFIPVDIENRVLESEGY